MVSYYAPFMLTTRVRMAMSGYGSIILSIMERTASGGHFRAGYLKME